MCKWGQKQWTGIDGKQTHVNKSLITDNIKIIIGTFLLRIQWDSLKISQSLQSYTSVPQWVLHGFLFFLNRNLTKIINVKINVCYSNIKIAERIDMKFGTRVHYGLGYKLGWQVTSAPARSRSRNTASRLAKCERSHWKVFPRQI